MTSLVVHNNEGQNFIPNAPPGILNDPSELECVKDQKTSFFDYSFNNLINILAEKFGAPRFRAIQLYQWVYRKHIFDPELMSDISKSFRAETNEFFSFTLPQYKSRQISNDGTRKYVFEVGGGDLIESVMIKQPGRMTLCVSSQVGCGMACSFCRTGTMGLKRNLKTSEIIGQVMAVIEDAKNFGDMFSNIVFMGMGEPLHNFDAVTDAIRILNAPDGLNISGRKITISSVGLVSAIEKFGACDAKASLALSLNATTDEVREKIMPVNKKFPIERLIEMIRNYPLEKRQVVTIEYVMLHGINDSKDDLGRLKKLLRGLKVKINLIPYNDNAGLGFTTPPTPWVNKWQQELHKAGLLTTIRWSKGKDIDAACGQLATVTKRAQKI